MRLPRLAAWRDAVNRNATSWLTTAWVRRRCIACHGASQAGALCVSCLNALPLNHSACVRCAEPLDTFLEGPALCAHCLTRMPAFDRVIAPLLYAPPVSNAVQALKFRGDLSAGRRLAQWLDHRLPELEPPDIVLPVPLHPSRTRERGFNQALEIARPLCRLRRWTLHPGVARRTRQTLAQTDLDADARRSNMSRAFEIQSDVHQAKVMVIDDVVTTGATTSALATELLRAGAETVWVIAAARTPFAQAATPRRKAPSTSRNRN